MNKLIISLFLIIFSGKLCALPVGNPADASLFCKGILFEDIIFNAAYLRVGFYGDYVFNRHIERRKTDFIKDLHSTKINTNAGLIVLNFWERLDFFTTLGVSRFLFKTFSNVDFGNAVSIESKPDFSWSVGARGTLWHCGPLFLGIEGQYFSASPSLNFIRNEQPFIGTAPGTNVITYLNGKRLDFREWQVGGGISYEIDTCSGISIIPYLAVKWSRADLDLHNIQNFGGFDVTTGVLNFDKLKNQKSVGYAVGVTVLGCHAVSLNVEGRFADEKALSVNSQYRF